MNFKVGDRVRYSGYSLQHKRDAWNQCGREPMKSNYKRDLDATAALRGTVTELLKVGLAVKWDNGIVSQCLDYIVTKE